MRNPAKLTAALTRLDWAARDAWDALAPAQQRALRRAQDGKVRVDTHPATRQVLEDAKLLEPTPRRAKVKSRDLTPDGLRVQAADPELGKRPR